MNYVEPIRDIEKVKDMSQALRDIDEKYYIMWKMGIYSGLRVSDILKLRIRDVKDKKEIVVIEMKTGKTKRFKINDHLKPILKEYCADKKDYEFLVPSSRKGKPVCREHAWWIINQAGKEVGISSIGTHTMRKTFGYHYYMKTKDVVLLQMIFNHSHPSVTLRYIGVTQDDINRAMNVVNFE